MMHALYLQKIYLHKRSPTRESRLFSILFFFTQTFEILDITHINRYFPFKDDILCSNKLGTRQFD